MNDYTPKIIKDTHSQNVYVEMVVEAKKCHICEKIMLPKIGRSLFPNYHHMDQESQMKRAGFVYSTSTEVNREPICIECKDAGKAYIKCALCNETKPSDKAQESFGYYPEYLCKDCYETVPAKIWEEKYSELSYSHRYDFE